MESLVLQSLGFRVNAPTAYTFLSLLKQHISLAPAVSALAVYLLVCHRCKYKLALPQPAKRSV